MSDAFQALSRRVLPLAAAVGFALAATPALARGPDGIADVAEKVIDAVVNISTSQTVEAKNNDGDKGSDERGNRRGANPQLPPDSPFSEFFDEFFKNRRGGPGGGNNSPRKVNSLGSGFIIDADGVVVTNNHVIADADEINVILNDGTKIKAELVGKDKKSDLAVLKFKPPEKKLTAVKFGNSDTLRLGEWVIAIGNPFSLGGTVTAGIVSARNRDINSGPYDNYIQTDAAINFGNSGGPLINARGEVIGINAAISSRASNIGFAVPINGATGILPQLREQGRVSRGYVGLTLRDLDVDLQRSLHIPVARGAVVQDVTDGSPGERAGLRPYDVIVGFDGVAIASDDELIHEISARPPGATAEMRVVRDDREFTVTVKLVERPGREGEARRPADTPPAVADPERGENRLGLTVRDLDPAAFNRLKLPRQTRGVLIARVDPLGPASDADVQRGTVLMEINRKPILSLADYTRLAAAIRPGDVVTVYVYAPDVAQRQLKTIRIDDR